MLDGGSERQRHQQLYDDLRKKLLDLSRRNPMLNYKHRVGSRRQLRIVNTNLEGTFAELTTKQRELPFAPLPEPDDIPEDELTDPFKAALGYAKSTDFDYLTRLTALEAVARQDDASLAKLERWLRDRIREQLELPPRPSRREFNLVEHARNKGIDPNYELSSTPPTDPSVIRQLQSMFFADELDSRLARIVADARLSEQETGLSTLFLAFGFMRWYESNDSDVANFAPLLLLPVQISKRLSGRRAVYNIKAASETPEINLSLRELMFRNSPDVSRHLPDFDEETDGIESYFQKVLIAIEGLNRWRIERNLTLGHFAFGRLAMYEDLSPDNWAEPPLEQSLLKSLLRGSEAESTGDFHFASDYDLDDETIENVAPILINDADGSQHSAIVDVMHEKNLVIEGPPGTGKSQTITNIIANALYAGKTVLFLADKLAALEVVKDRLDAASLGEFCLELHSDKAHPKPIVESLKQRYELTQHAKAEPNWAEDLQRLRSARTRVREYLSALHDPDENDDRTPFDLIWSTIAARRELSEEFELVRRINLESIFDKSRQEIDRCKDVLRLYTHALRDYAERHGSFVNAVWSKASFITLLVNDPDIFADNIRDTYKSSRALNELLATTSSTLGLNLPRHTDAISAWIVSTSRLPAIDADYFLPQLGAFPPTEIEAAAKLAAERIDLIGRPVTDLSPNNIKSVSQLAQQVTKAGMADLSPVEIVARAAHVGSRREAIIKSVQIFSRLIDAFRPATAPTIATACGIAKIAQFAKKVPSELDPYLWFDCMECEEALSEGASRLLSLSRRDRALRARLEISADTQWPSLDDLRLAEAAYSATGLRRIGASLTGKRRRATRLIAKMGGIELRANDISEVIQLVEDELAFVADTTLSSAAGSAWSDFSTPFGELLAVVRLRARFTAEIGGSNGFVESVYRALFSSNTRVVDALRQYEPWSGPLLKLLREWPDRLEGVLLTKAAERITARVETFTTLVAQIQKLEIGALAASFAQILKEAERQLRVKIIEGEIGGHQVFAATGEQAWVSPNGCRSLQKSAEIAKVITAISPDAEIRARIFSQGSANFRRSLNFAATAISQVLSDYTAALDRLTKTIELPEGSSGVEPGAVAEWLAPFINELASLREWLEVARRRSNLQADGIDALVDAFENSQVSLDRIPETFSALAFYHRAMRARQKHSVLRSMKSLDLENERARFVTADETLKKRQREAVRMKLLRITIPAGSANGPKRSWTDLQCLRNEFTKQAKHLQIRRLLSQSARAVQALKPCFMMSPLSLAKFLPSRIMTFDLLVVDEASQMKPEDSIGGLLRAKKVVVVGDPNQLPPSDFFSRITPADEGGAENEDEGDDIDAESILDWSLKTFHAPRRLKWHYRSRCESLIAFSNREFYSSKPGSHGDLVTFPNARPDAFSIDLVRVNGNYKASRNPAEVARIVEAAIDFMIQHADLADEEIPTLGIVAINIEQRDAIREEFNRSARDEAIERYLNACNKGTSKRGPEPFFIKNLENVQGDERDFIMISLTYGREVGQERVAQRFGPITRGQGHRRLNVLFTRARQRIILFSSMSSDDVLVTPATKRGVRVLRDYLRYVESRRLDVGVPTGRDFDSDFERDVRARLETRGFVVDPQVGVSGYRIDLGVKHPDHPGVYLAGIECDGAAFHSAKSARDRDRLRESVLRGKGWTILRVWSTDWFENSELQTDRLVSELRRLASRPVEVQSRWTIVSEAPLQSRGLEPKDGVTSLISEQRDSKSARVAEVDVKSRLRAFRNSKIIGDFPDLDPERCILRDIMIDKIVQSRLDEPEDFTRKIPLWLRERTDQKQLKYLEQICSIVEGLDREKND